MKGTVALITEGIKAPITVIPKTVAALVNAVSLFFRVVTNLTPCL